MLRRFRQPLFLLLALGAYTEAQACPCGCVKVCIDNLADRSAARAGAYTFDFRYDTIDQDERNSGAHAHFLAYHRILTGTIETQLAGQTWSIAVPRISRIVRSNIAPTVLNPNPINTRQEVVGLGDVSVSTRFAWSDYTVIAGVKLPTGTDDLTFLVATCSPGPAQRISSSVCAEIMRRPATGRSASGSSVRRALSFPTRTSALAQP